VSTLKKTPKGGKLKMPFVNLLHLNRFSKKFYENTKLSGLIRFFEIGLETREL